jgi:hypothetical protein
MGRGCIPRPTVISTRYLCEGGFKNGATWEGVIAFADGDTYEGGFENGERHGWEGGAYTSANGDKYE